MREYDQVNAEPGETVRVPSSTGHTVLDKAVSVAGGRAEMSPEDFSRIAALLGLEVSTITVEKGSKLPMDGTTFSLEGIHGNKKGMPYPKMVFRNYRIDKAAAGRPTMSESREGRMREKVERWQTEVEWNPQTWCSGQNVDHAVDGDDGGFLMLPSESLAFPFMELARRLGRKGPDTKRMKKVVEEAARNATFSKLSFNVHLTPIRTEAIDVFIDVMAAGFAWRTGTDLSGYAADEGAKRKRMRMMGFASESGIAFKSYCEGDESAVTGFTGFSLKAGGMKLICYRKDVQANVQHGNGELRLEVSLSPSLLKTCAGIRDVLQLPADQHSTWYGSASCLAAMEESLGDHVEEAFRGVIRVFMKRMGFPLFLNIQDAGGWMGWLEERMKPILRNHGDSEVSGPIGKKFLNESMKAWLGGGKKTPSAVAEKHRRAAGVVHQIMEETLGWEMAQFTANSVNLLYHALAMGTLSRNAHYRLMNAAKTGDTDTIAALNRTAFRRVEQLSAETSKMRLLGRS